MEWRSSPAQRTSLKQEEEKGWARGGRVEGVRWHGVRSKAVPSSSV